MVYSGALNDRANAPNQYYELLAEHTGKVQFVPPSKPAYDLSLA